MKKTLLQTRMNRVTQDRFPDSPPVPGDNSDRAEKQETKLRSRFNPSQVGFGILGRGKDVRYAASIDEEITSEIKLEEGQ